MKKTYIQPELRKMAFRQANLLSTSGRIVGDGIDMQISNEDAEYDGD